MLVRETMTSKVVCASPKMTIAEAAKLMRKHDVGALPIAQEDGLMGIVTDRDICCRGIGQGLNPYDTPIDEIMSRDVVTCFEDDELAEAAAMMERRKVRRLPVLNRKGGLVGMMTLGDLSHYAGPELTAEVEYRITQH